MQRDRLNITGASLPLLLPELFVNGQRDGDVRNDFREKPAARSGQQRAREREAKERARRDALYAKAKDPTND